MNVLVKEVKIFVRSGVVFMSLLTPLILVLCFGLAITGTIHNVPIGLTSTSEQPDPQTISVITTALTHDNDFVLQTISSQNALGMVQSGSVRAVIEVTGTYSNTVNITLLIDSTDRSIKDQLQFSLTSLLYENLGEQKFIVNIIVQDLYSGKSLFAYLVPSILVLGAIFGGLFYAADSILEEKEEKTIETVITAGFSPIRFSIEKIVSFLITVFIGEMVAFIFILVLSGITPTLMQILLSLVTVLLSALIFVTLGLACSTFIPNRETLGPIMGTLIFPLMFLSGTFLSIYSMDPLIMPIAQLNPITVASTILGTILLKNGSLSEIIEPLSFLLVINSVLFCLTVYRINKIIQVLQK